MAFYRSDTGRIQVSVTGIALDTVSWDTMSTAQLAADNSYYHPGNMGPATPTGGLATPSDITVTRRWSDTLFAQYVALWNAVPLSTTMTVIYTPLNVDTTTAVKPITYSGILTTVTQPEFEAASSSIVYFSVIMAPNQSISQN